MEKTANQTRKLERHVSSLQEAVQKENIPVAIQILQDLPSAEIAHVLESSPPKSRKLIWENTEDEQRSEVLSYLTDELASEFLAKLPAQEASKLITDIATDDVADMLQEMPEHLSQNILEEMDEENRHKIEEILHYDEDSAGGWMSQDVVTIKADISVAVVLRYLRRFDALPKLTSSLWVVNKKSQYIGKTSLNSLVTTNPDILIREIMDTGFEPIDVDMAIQDVAQLFERRDLISAPVVDSNKNLVGRITIDDIVDVIMEEASHSMMSLAKMDDDEDTFAPILKTSRRRAVWLGINLLTAFIAAAVVGLFSETIEQVVALAVLMPVVASMGGIAGSQTLTLVIRGMALGHISSANSRYLVNKELWVGFLNGLLWCIVVAIIAFVWFNDHTLSLIIGIAMVFNLVIAALIGAVLPLILKRIKIDPALAGSVILTTVTDVVGFLSFLGLATILYL